MTKLLWDQVGERLYEAGLDRGVLYLDDDRGVAWNGLISVEEDTSEDTSEPVYFDGVKVFDDPSIGDFTATLSAFTYPDEFLEYEGMSPLSEGLSVDDQDPKLFGLSYRTLIGNDISGLDHAYKIHLLYNLTAIPNDTSYETLSDTPGTTAFSWKLSTIPVKVPSFRPTAHVVIDSRYISADILESIEDILYGTESIVGDAVYDGGTPYSFGGSEIDGEGPSTVDVELPDTGLSSAGDPRLIGVGELLDMAANWGPRKITPNPITGLAVLTLETGDLTQGTHPGIYSELPTSRLAETSVEGFYVLV